MKMDKSKSNKQPKPLENQLNRITDANTPKTFDIHQHLRLNKKNLNKQCSCPLSTVPSYYCIPCNETVCQQCDLNIHIKHSLVTKRNMELNKADIEQIFSSITQCLNTSEVYTKINDHKAICREKINKSSDELVAKVNRHRQAKLDEVNMIFNSMAEYAKKTKELIENTKKEMRTYYEKAKEFYGYGQTIDDTNTVFLLHFDMINIVYQRTLLMNDLTNSFNVDLSNYDKNEDEVRRKLDEKIEEALFKQMKEEKEKSERQQTQMKNYTPLMKVNHDLNLLSSDHFKEVNDRLEAYTYQMNIFQDRVFDSYTRKRNLIEIEKDLNIIELSSMHKGIDNLFTKRSINNNEAILTEECNRASVCRRVVFNTKEDINLTNALLKRLYYNMIIEFYGNNFKCKSRELQSSITDLMIKFNPDDDDVDYAKIHEGTNCITLYDQKNKKMTKLKLPLKYNPHSYIIFPTGCRCILLGDKLYITGGRDEKMEYATVLVYDRKTNNLKRIRDMKEARSYHTISYSDALGTLLVFGGEMTETCEVYDPTINGWHLLPSLNYPRANILFHFDKPRGLWYTMFGIEGKIKDNRYSDVIEVLDLTQPRNGWIRLDYYNKAEISLRSYLNIFPLNNSYLLLFGGNSARSGTKGLCLMNLLKNDIEMIDKLLFEQLRIEAKKSEKLRGIMSTYMK